MEILSEILKAIGEYVFSADGKRLLIALTTLAIAFAIPYVLGRLIKRPIEYHKEVVSTVMLAVIPALLYVVAGVNKAICGSLPADFHHLLGFLEELMRWWKLAIDHLVNLPVHLQVTAMILPVTVIVVGSIVVGVKIPDEEFLPNFWFVMRIIVLPTILIFAFITWIVDLIVVNLTPDEMVLGGGLLTVFIITACVGGGGTAIVIIIKD